MLDDLGGKLWSHAIIRDKILGMIHVPDGMAVDGHGRVKQDDKALARLLTVDKATFESGIIRLYKVNKGYGKKSATASGETLASLHAYMFGVGASFARIDLYASKVRTLILGEPVTALANVDVPDIRFHFRLLERLVMRGTLVDIETERPVPVTSFDSHPEFVAHLNPFTTAIKLVSMRIVYDQIFAGDYLAKFLAATGKGNGADVERAVDRIVVTALDASDLVMDNEYLKDSATASQFLGSFDRTMCTELCISGVWLKQEEALCVARTSPHLRKLDLRLQSSNAGSDLFCQIAMLLPNVIDLTIRNGAEEYWDIPLAVFLDSFVGSLPGLRDLGLDLESGELPETEHAVDAFFSPPGLPKYPALCTLNLFVLCRLPHRLSAMETNAQVMALVSPECDVSACGQVYAEDPESADVWATEFNLGRKALLRALAKLRPESVVGWRHMEEEREGES